MKALRIVGAAVLIAGIAGTVLFVAWFFEYTLGLGGFFSSLSGSLPLIVTLGFLWGPLLIYIGLALLYVSARIREKAVISP